MIPTWTVYRKEDGKFDAFWEVEEDRKIDPVTVVGYVTCKEKRAAIAYMEALLVP